MSSHFLSKEDQSRIVDAIKSAECNTSGEIRVHIEPRCGNDPIGRAVYIFNRLKMYRTAERNGVLIYVAYDSRKFSIIGDKGINDRVPADFWEEVRQVMHSHFVKSDFTEGIVSAVTLAGEKLSLYFPYKKDDVNEQPDEISFG